MHLCPRHVTSAALASLAILLAATTGSAAAGEATAAQLWAEYQAAPNVHPNLPNCSFAGYGRGELPLPQVPVVANVKDCGATGDGTSDDLPAFRAAIAKAAGKGAVLIPAGTYRLVGHLVLPSNTVLRGEGPAKTILDFTKSLTDSLGPLPDAGGSSQWSWTGGLIWVTPADTFAADGKVANVRPEQMQGWEYWRPGPALATATGNAKRGDTQVTVTNGLALKPGQLVVMTWENPADASLLKHIAGHPSMDAYDWKSASAILPPQYPQWQWPVEIKAVSGNTVTLAQPLRVDIRPEWGVAMREPGPHVRGAGVEDLHLQLHAPRDHRHLKCLGWNAIAFNRAYDCWARNVQITNAENPLIFAAAKNCTATGLVIDGESQNHHSIAMRVNTHDCLVQDFSVAGMWRVKHGINVEWLSSGNVYSKGTMAKGTFDSHRALSFDLIRTEINLTNDADGPGGAGNSGPFLGARVAHWNIQVNPAATPSESNKNAAGDFVFMPLTFPMGAFVGIRGCEPSMTVRDTVPGEKGSVIAEVGKSPAIKNLYQAELDLRLGRKP
jgi:hypothetical protein